MRVTGGEVTGIFDLSPMERVQAELKEFGLHLIAREYALQAMRPSAGIRKCMVYKTLAIGSLLVAGGLVAFFAFGQSVRWVGRTDLDVRFIVTDAETGQPIPDATIHIRAEPGGFCADSPQPEFTLTTDDNGHARQLATNCMCFGSKGPFEESFGSHLPRWTFYATADQYSATDPAELDVLENAREVQRGDTLATLSVSIRLQKI